MGMVNFMCWTDWTILGVSVRVLLEEINIWNGRLSRLSSRIWVGLIQSMGGLNRTKQGVGEKLVSQTVFQLEHWSFPIISWWLAPLALLIFRPLDLDWNYTMLLAFLGVQLAVSRWWDFSTSVIMWANSLFILSPPHLFFPPSLPPLLVLFLWRTLIKRDMENIEAYIVGKAFDYQVTRWSIHVSHPLSLAILCLLSALLNKVAMAAGMEVIIHVLKMMGLLSLRLNWLPLLLSI